jgi:hypothetical protein
MKYVSKEQLVTSLRNLARFREAVNKQGAQHILPFLALKRAGAKPSRYILYSEAGDFDFFNGFCRVRGGREPYFDPIASAFRIDTHPHSNAATARKGTFARSWHAGEYRSTAEGDEWTLDENYIDAVRAKVLTKHKVCTLIPALDIIAFLYRQHEFEDKVKLSDAVAQFKKEFKLSDGEFGSLFEIKPGLKESDFFTDHQMSTGDVLSAIDESGVLRDLRLEGGAAPAEPPPPASIQENDPILAQALNSLHQDGYAGVVLVGPPGTSKSWYAIQIARVLAGGGDERIFKIQFHRSYQYENFVEGYVPKLDGSGFELRDQLALAVARQADDNPDLHYVIVIDELSRSDPGRVFGELLTYMEPTRRGEPFLLASGRETSLPRNLYFVATMNSRDKSVVEIDDAFDRRLAKIPMDPSPAILEQFLVANDVDEPLRARVIEFFKWVNETHYPLGHTFFLNVKDGNGLRRLWDNQLRFVFQKAFLHERETVEQIRAKYVAMLASTAGQ